jgi:hypothetical protein
MLPKRKPRCTSTWTPRRAPHWRQP